MTFEAAQRILDQHNQGHVLAFYDDLSQPEQTALLEQIASIDFDAIRQMQETLLKGNEATAGGGTDIVPAPVLELPEVHARAEASAKVGAAALKMGRVGVLLVAGGQGSRLGFEGPKGAYEIGPLSGASLFEIHARKILALERHYQAEIPFYIMTSQANDADTRSFFVQHNYFGLAPDRVLFFSQGMWPALRDDGTLILESPGKIFMNPDGHGGTIRALELKGMFADMDQRGVDTLFYFQVDNPLVEIADPVFIGLHLSESADVSVKVCEKRDPGEKIGVVVERDGQSCIVEYSELTPEQMAATQPDGRLWLLYGSVAIHVFSVAFLKKAAKRPMLLHLAHKQVPYVDSQKKTVKPENPNAWKFEKFIFDVLPDADRVLHVAFDRSLEFSPVKNAAGEDSPATTKRDMIRKFAGWMESCGVTVARGADGEPRYQIEIDPCYAFSAEDLRTRLDGAFQWDADLLLAEDDEA
ncbi:MAG: UTP--glucose-1-phosphate uridylyltransferase [Kiritimatiellia bacterium]